MLRRIAAFFTAFFLCLSMAAPSFASVATPSNAQVEIPALMSASESISAYSVSSSIPAFTNTVDYSYVSYRNPFCYCLEVSYYDDAGGPFVTWIPINDDGTFSYSPSDISSSLRYIERVSICIRGGAVPPVGDYFFEYAIFSNVGSASGISEAFVYSESLINNANTVVGRSSIPSEQVYYNGADCYACANVHISKPGQLILFSFLFDSATGYFPTTNNGEVRVGFTSISGEVDFSTSGSYSSIDTENAIAGSSSQTAENTSRIADAIENLASDFAASMEPHYDNILTQLHHITEQLHAFWNQLAAMYNDTILPHMTAQTDRIVTAIENIDLTFEVHMDELIENDNRLHDQLIENDNYHAEQIMEGYDKTELEQSDQLLSDSMEEQQAQEQQILDQISGPLESFEFDNPVTQYLSTFKLFGDFLQDLFTNSWAFADVINLSFIMGIALMVAGLYRFKGGN